MRLVVRRRSSVGRNAFLCIFSALGQASAVLCSVSNVERDRIPVCETVKKGRGRCRRGVGDRGNNIVEF